MKPLEAIVTGVLSTAVFLTGCAPSYQRYPTLQKKTEAQQIVTKQEVFSHSDISIISRGIDRNETDIDKLIEVSQDYIDYLEFRENYSDYENRIVSNLKSNKFNDADELVRGLAGKLERDNNPYAKLYLDKVQSFTYIMYSYYTASTGKKTEIVSKAWNYQVADAMELLLSPLNMAFNGNMGRYNSMEETEVKEQFYDEILVHPYRNSREILRSGVPLQGSQLQMNIDSIRQQQAIEKARQEQIQKSNRTIEKVREVVKKYENEFSKIRVKTNPDLWGNSIPDSHTEAGVWVDDQDISKKIRALYSQLLEEGPHPLYEPLKNNIRTFEYCNITVEVKNNLIETLLDKRYIYDKTVTGMYRFNPYTGSRTPLQGYGRFIGIHPGFLSRTRVNLQDFFEHNKPK